ncbi:zinc-binding dehydrogenase [Propioniciclava coleopterorum]|uniref:Zinc-binding dehydrogenase n=1 Tax=Propioniciclava coleopterorum TaxID=2714937 RepID=A0A6G7Y2R8_9ACTN|nr:zinc-binding dehydrogenase [Propioniciclava coleopterorum]QIK70986.1 zinc-binding dehydrogenase [Propioniciclava coleopterorum]
MTTAAVLHEVDADLVVETVVLTSPGPREVRVALAASGICHSDVMVARGGMASPLPIILGHEGSGVVLEVGSDVTRVRVGDHVALSWAPECGQCFYCLSGRSNLCAEYAPRVLDGGLLDGTSRFRSTGGDTIAQYSFLSTFTEETIVAEQSCVPISADMPLLPASLIGCAVMTGVGAALFSGNVRAGDTVAVLGGGGVGINAVQGAAIAGAGRVIVVDANPAKRETVSAFGATDFLLTGDGDPAAQVLELTHGRGADVVIDATGDAAAMAAAYSAARRGGRIVYVGVAPSDAVVALPAARLPREEKVITGSFYGGAVPLRDFPLVVDLYQSGRLKLDELVGAVVPLARINDVFGKPSNAARSVIDFGLGA